MKKLMAALLCLMLVLPLHTYADSTESQPAQQTESQPPQQTESQPPEQTETQPPQQTESQPPEQTETQPPQQTESQPPEQTETQPSDHTHNWDVSYTLPATCKDEGATGYGCSACGAIHVEILPKLTTHTYDNVCDPHCNVCDLNREVPHKFSAQWSRNASGHWYACSICGEKTDFGKHYPGPAATEEKAQICLTCGYTLTAKKGHSHKYETELTSDETGHWYACSGCDEQKDFESHSYDNGCDSDCNVCGFLTAAAHIYSRTWYSDQEGHWDVCTICQEKSAVESHIPDPEATETEAQLCIACGFALTSALDPTEHIHKEEGAWLTDAENHWKVCACGENMEVQPHLWDEGQEQEDNTILYTCEDCGATRTESQPKTNTTSLVWISIIIVALLGTAAAVLFLLIRQLKKGGKYRK